ncbi:tetratricopeptide repeat protein [Verrucomicrobiaceae bacterium R5-34]|nr:tetratricopeptide repeat protein [Verrucomicrobiaceae bacterium R5-34]
MPIFILCGVLLALPQQLSAQQDPRALAPADVFFQAWLTIRDAEKLETENKHSDAWRKYRQAAKYYDILSRYHSKWKPHLVEERVKTTRESIKEIEPKAAAELAGKQAKTKDLVEGGPQVPQGGQAQPLASGHAIQPSIARNSGDQEIQRRLKILEVDNKRLRDTLSRARSTGSGGGKAEEQRLIDQIARRDRELTTLRNILARAPLQKDMDQLAHQNRTIKAEINITARALKESQKKLKATQKMAEKYKEDALLSQSRAEEIQKNMEAQKKIDNRVVRELRKELTTVTEMLNNTRRELGAANATIARMERSLTQSQATIDELTRERNELRTERDTLANILKQNDSEGVQKLIAENMRLGKELKESMDRLEYLKKENNATKDELVEAKRDLAIAKTRIMKYQHEQSDHSRRIKTLERQLRDAEADLLASRGKNPGSRNNSAKAEEIEILKATVKRLIASQERRRTAEKILWDTYQKSKVNIPGMPEVIRDIRNAKVELTDQEKVLMTVRRPDSEFMGPERVSRTHAQAFGNALEQEIATYTPLMKRAFEKQRYEAARQILQDMDERFPGHFPTLCNRGVVELKTENYDKASDFFNEAITMRENSSYAHQMLGLSLYHSEDFDGARNAFERALDLKPGNAKAHLYLGNVAGGSKRFNQAEEHFLAAIKLDPTLFEAYFNLSVLYLQQNEKEKASEFYGKALEHGLPPNPTHEQKLGK